MRLSPSQLTTGEALLLSRRRAGWTQAQAARALGVTYRRYRRWEDDESVPSQAPPPVVLVRLEPHERALVLRRRRGTSRGELAAALGVTVQWVTEMERGRAPARRLAAYWEAQGS